jgi:hypothetical protein
VDFKQEFRYAFYVEDILPVIKVYIELLGFVFFACGPSL